jgi:hypothetical protein
MPRKSPRKTTVTFMTAHGVKSFRAKSKRRGARTAAELEGNLKRLRSPKAAQKARVKWYRAHGM